MATNKTGFGREIRIQICFVYKITLGRAMEWHINSGHIIHWHVYFSNHF